MDMDDREATLKTIEDLKKEIVQAKKRGDKEWLRSAEKQIIECMVALGWKERNKP